MTALPRTGGTKGSRGIRSRGAGLKATRGGFIACKSEEVFRELLRAQTTRDERYIEFLLKGVPDAPQVCQKMSKGTRVTVVDSGWMLQDLRIVRWAKFRLVMLPPLHEEEPDFRWTKFASLERAPTGERANALRPDPADTSPRTVTQFVIEDGKLMETRQVDRDTMKSSPTYVIRDGEVVEVIPPETTPTWEVRDGKFVELSPEDRNTLRRKNYWVLRDNKYVEVSQEDHDTHRKEASKEE